MNEDFNEIVARERPNDAPSYQIVACRLGRVQYGTRQNSLGLDVATTRMSAPPRRHGRNTSAEDAKPAGEAAANLVARGKPKACGRCGITSSNHATACASSLPRGAPTQRPKRISATSLAAWLSSLSAVEMWSFSHQPERVVTASDSDQTCSGSPTV